MQIPKVFREPATACAALVLGASICGAASSAQASFHFMQIEQLIGGVNGDTNAQAIQLRMRSSNQNQVQNSRLVAFDATGSNPIVVAAPSSSVSGAAAGARVLIASAAFATATTPEALPDFTLTALIPASYLAAGSLAFQNGSGSITYWRLSWGGGSYTGATTGSTTNDANGEFGPPFAAGLPSDGIDALLFQGSASALSTSNDQDYQITPGSAVFTNNGGDTFAVDGATDARSVPRAAMLHPSYPNPFNARTTLAFELSRETVLRLQVFSVRGDLVDTVMENRLPAGRHTTIWNGRDRSGRELGSGAYFVRLVTPGETRSRTITLIK